MHNCANEGIAVRPHHFIVHIYYEVGFPKNFNLIGHKQELISTYSSSSTYSRGCILFKFMVKINLD